ncbi:glycosyltransferase family 4 protein [Candidatus Woesearchaeota archaeon]|nr:glycosyltransferase family 4 protein [Candidatus Woesearchaeota archaeon]
MSNKKLSVLMVTGVYYPEVNGATLQCMRVISTLKKDVNFSVLTTTKYKNIAKNNVIDGIDVYRHYIGNRLGKFSQLFGISWIFLTKKIDIVHLHGFSSRSALIVLISKIFNKKVIIKMTSFGHDDAISIQNKSRLFFLIYSLADTYIGVSPIFKEMYLKSELNERKYYQIPNGVDTNLFLPLANVKEKNELRSELGLPIDISLILVVGHFSIDKSANHVLDAWLRIQKESNNQSGIVFIGSTDSNSFEVDRNIVNLIHSKSKQFIGECVFFVEKTNHIEQYYQAADVYVLSSAREGLPNTLLEAMSCALPVISTRLKGITDWVLNHNVNGMMYDYGDIDALGILLENLLQDNNLCKHIGSNARTTIKDNFNILSTAEKIHKIYEDL